MTDRFRHGDGSVPGQGHLLDRDNAQPELRDALGKPEWGMQIMALLIRR